ESEGAGQLLDHLRKLVEKKGEPAGQKQIGAVQAQGFRVKEDDRETVIWADPKTKQPLLVEMTWRTGSVEIHYSVSDFELNPKLDDALFRLEPPAGYQFRTMKMNTKKPEENVIALLRAYAEKSGGTFPKRLDDWMGYAKAFAGEKKP